MSKASKKTKAGLGIVNIDGVPLRVHHNDSPFRVRVIRGTPLRLQTMKDYEVQVLVKGKWVPVLLNGKLLEFTYESQASYALAQLANGRPNHIEFEK